MNQQSVTSFVVRFQKRSKDYKIKVTHVQKEQDLTFERMEDVFQYMQDQLDEENENNSGEER